jgi:hypothetical protein
LDTINLTYNRIVTTLWKNPGWGDTRGDGATWAEPGRGVKASTGLPSLAHLPRMICSRRGIQKRPLVQAKGTQRQSNNAQSLMEQFNSRDMESVVFIAFILRVEAPISNSVGKASSSQPHQGRSSLLPVPPAQPHHSAATLLRDNWTHTGGIRLFHRDSAMPRIRGKLRRGATWYAAESRRRRKKDFERAMAIISRRRRTRSRLHSKEREEEVNPQANLPGHSRHTMSVALTNQNPSSSLSTHCTRQPTDDEPDPSTCQVAKEAPPEP